MARMISQALAEEAPDYAMPQAVTRPWIRRSSAAAEQSDANGCSKEDTDILLSGDGIAHIEK